MEKSNFLTFQFLKKSRNSIPKYWQKCPHLVTKIMEPNPLQVAFEFWNSSGSKDFMRLFFRNFKWCIFNRKYYIQCITVSVHYFFHITWIFFREFIWRKSLEIICKYQRSIVVSKKLLYLLHYNLRLYIFYPIFHDGLYCRAVSVTDNLCTKQGFF